MTASDFLGSTTNEQWYCPDVIDFPLLASFPEKEKDGSTNDYISVNNKTTHPESNLVRLLHRLKNPASSSISQWAKIVAASLELMADNLYKPPPPEIIQGADPTIQGVRILNYLDDLKHSTAIFDQTVDNNNNNNKNDTNHPSDPTAEVLDRAHSVDVLHEFSNLIVDVVMGYVILQTHALGPPPLTTTQRKNTYRTTRNSTRRASSKASAMVHQKKKQLKK